MRASWLSVVVPSLVALACGSKSPAPSTPDERAPSTTEPGAPAAAAPVKLGQLVVAKANAVTRTSFEHFVVATYIHELIGPGPACWTELERAVTATYQIQTPEPSSYFILEGNLPRATVESCIPATFRDKVDVKLATDGELLVFDLGELGKTFVAWRDRYVVVGERPQVVAALATPTDAGNPWPGRLSPIGAAPVWAYRTDRLMESLFGVGTKSYLVELDRLVTKPAPQFTGKITIWYGNNADAATSARRIKAGELAVQTSPDLVEVFRQMKVTQAGTVVTLAFDHTDFSLIDLDELLDLASRWAAGA